MLAAVLMLATPALAVSPAYTPKAIAPAMPGGDSQLVKGACTPKSHTASGGLKEDIRGKHTAFLCDSVIVTFLDNQRKHVLVQFTLQNSRSARVIGFEGVVEGGEGVFRVRQMFLERGKTFAADDGGCRISYSGRTPNALACGASMHQEKSRTVAIVEFKAAAR